MEPSVLRAQLSGPSSRARAGEPEPGLALAPTEIIGASFWAQVWRGAGDPWDDERFERLRPLSPSARIPTLNFRCWLKKEKNGSALAGSFVSN